ncbi:RNA polymerase sigma factor SigY [Alkaliphilus hydrothermalis]|uniref:RNA polymerase sigma-70 factor (ECF subfamily) n=1 Tax=Alkaliphilus hydrothermalis TaxID=1482730 RepID=A0ABS2NMZ6_9FIRM|nr:RNA polymerase sigma factor SigY [Alkaliphilus hydrothermalis]MBM7614291.1 RNA polymerase sigma-70 factor (ECF subfamily) [Alkaliphilus hydrothermalis]
MEEHLLVKMAKRQDKKAMEKLLQSNYSILKGYLLKMTLNPTLADDLTQETMLKAVLNISKYEHRGKFSTWLITIGTNLHRDQLRKNKRLVYSEEHMELVDHHNIEEEFIKKIEYGNLMKVLKEIPEEKRVVLILKHYYDYSYLEIAEILDCPIGTIRSRLHYAIKVLQKTMKGGEDIE